MIDNTIVGLLRDPEPKACFAMGQRPWQQRMIASVAAFVVACSMIGTSPALQAHEGDQAQGPQIKHVELGAVESREGESKSDFMLRTARYLDAFTRTTGHEACGSIASNEQGQWRVRLTTNRSQIACVLVDFDETQRGWEATGESIHSHPLMQYAFKANLQDTMLTSMMGNGTVCGNRVRTDDFNFSDRDYDNGSGYLVARGRLLYQGKPGERLEIGRVDRHSPLEALELPPISSGRAQAIQASQAAWEAGDAEGLPRTECYPIKKRQGS